MLEKFGKIVYRHRWLTLALAAAFLAASMAMLARGGALAGGTIHGLEAERAAELVSEVRGHAADSTFVAVFHAGDLYPQSGAYRAAVRRALEPLRADPRVLSVVGPEDVPPPLRPGMVNGPARSALALVTLAGDPKTALDAYPAVRERLRSDRLDIACTGRIPFLSDMNRTLERDLFWAELVSLPIALLILLLVFRTAVAALLPVGVGGLAVAGSTAIVLALSRHTEIAQYAINVSSLLGLGLAIDYSLFTVSRYREELAAGHDYPEALSRAVGRAGRVVAFSGVAVGTGLGGLLFFDGSYLASIGIAGAIVVVLAVIFALTFLPALLAVLGPWIHAGRLPFARRTRAAGTWHRLATGVMRHPVAMLIPTAAALLLMGVPYLHRRVAAADVGVLADTVEARRGYDALARDFPDRALTRMVVVARFPSDAAPAGERAGAIRDLSRRITALPDVLRVEGDAEAARRAAAGDRAAVLDVVTSRASESEEARGIVRAIRADRRVGDGTLLVGGSTAGDLDTAAYMHAREPRAVAFVVVVTGVVLFLLLGSVVLPLKALAMNFFSIAGSFGALVWIFQDGHLFVSERRPLDPSIPVLLFCVLFGLSMDYEVLMLSRIREAYKESGDNTRAVAEGLEKTAGIITSAAAIMVAVFISFSFARVELIQAVGVGMAIAVAIDATLVRVILVPSTMRLLGHVNWWAPRALRDMREHVVHSQAPPRAGAA